MTVRNYKQSMATIKKSFNTDIEAYIVSVSRFIYSIPQKSANIFLRANFVDQYF